MGEEKRRSKRKTIFGEEKYIFVAAKKKREGKGEKIIFFWRRKNDEGKLDDINVVFAQRLQLVMLISMD